MKWETPKDSADLWNLLGHLLVETGESISADVARVRVAAAAQMNVLLGKEIELAVLRRAIGASEHRFGTMKPGERIDLAADAPPRKRIKAALLSDNGEA